MLLKKKKMEEKKKITHKTRRFSNLLLSDIRVPVGTVAIVSFSLPTGVALRGQHFLRSEIIF